MFFVTKPQTLMLMKLSECTVEIFSCEVFYQFAFYVSLLERNNMLFSFALKYYDEWLLFKYFVINHQVQMPSPTAFVIIFLCI
jgi:hypothetical protein